MKKLIFTFLVLMITFLIYYLNMSNKVYYLSLGDYLSYGINDKNVVDNSYSDNIKNKYKKNLKNYINYSSIDDYRVMDLINDINYNKSIKYEGREYKFQNLLIKANIITISIGMNDLIYKQDIDYDYVDELINDIDMLFNIIRKYNKDKIYYLGFYDVINNKDIINYLNERVQNKCGKYNITFVNIDDLDKYITKGIYPSNDGYTYITERINFEKR